MKSEGEDPQSDHLKLNLDGTEIRYFMIVESEDREVAESAGVSPMELSDVKGIGGSRCKDNVWCL